jgi:polysaccharide export outer membrane protein
LFTLQFCLAVAAQEGPAQFLGASEKASQSGTTGPGVGSSRTTIAAASGEADGLGNSLLGGNRRPPYRLCVSDVIEVSFTLSPEFNQTLTVQPDGYVALKDAGTVYAHGLTLEEFTRAARKAYDGYLHDPQIAVALKEFEHPYFIAGGELGKPGKYELRSDLTVMEGVEIAGGFTQEAKHSQVVLFRRTNNDMVEARVLNLKKMLKANNLAEDPLLRPGDFIFVPQNAISKIARFLSKPSMSMYLNSSQF